MQAQTARAAQTNRIAEAVQRGQLDTLTLWAAIQNYAAKRPSAGWLRCITAAAWNLTI